MGWWVVVGSFHFVNKKKKYFLVYCIWSLGVPITHHSPQTRHIYNNLFFFHNIRLKFGNILTSNHKPPKHYNFYNTTILPSITIF